MSCVLHSFWLDDKFSYFAGSIEQAWRSEGVCADCEGNNWGRARMGPSFGESEIYSNRWCGLLHNQIWSPIWRELNFATSLCCWKSRPWNHPQGTIFPRAWYIANLLLKTFFNILSPWQQTMENPDLVIFCVKAKRINEAEDPFLKNVEAYFRKAWN